MEHLVLSSDHYLIKIFAPSYADTVGCVDQGLICSGLNSDAVVDDTRLETSPLASFVVSMCSTESLHQIMIDMRFSMRDNLKPGIFAFLTLAVLENAGLEKCRLAILLIVVEAPFCVTSGKLCVLAKPRML